MQAGDDARPTGEKAMTVVEWQISHTLPGVILALLEAPAPRKHARAYTESSFELTDRQLEEVLSDLPDTQPPYAPEPEDVVAEESSLCFL
jgi:hypothetical protein